MRLSSRAAALVAALATAAALPAAASADDPPPPTTVGISSSPLSIAIGSQGQLQAHRAGDSSNIFYSPTKDLGDAGFFLAFPPTTAAGPTAPAQPTPLSGKVYGFSGTAGPHFLDEDYTFTQSGQAAVTGDGSAGNPFTQVTTYSAAADMDNNDATPDTDVAVIAQTTTYVAGAQTFTVRWDVKNVTAQPLRFKAIAAADFYFEGSDVGTGIFTQGPPRFVGGTNADTGRSGGFVEIPDPAPLLPWSHYQALAYTDPSGNDVWDRLADAGDAITPSYDDSVLGEPVDNAGAVEWDQYLDPATTLPAGQTTSFALMVRTALPAALQFDQTNAGAPQGVPIAFRVTAKDTADNPFTGKRLLSTITGANPGTQAATIAADGTATVTDPGLNAGADTVVSFVDLNNNGTREPNEPQGSALATFVDRTPPSCRVTVTGDRPVGAGGQGKPLVITVNCDSPATVTSASTLTITPPATRTRATRKRAHRADAARAKRKPKKRAKARKPKRVVVRLRASTVTVAPGTAVPVNITIPSSVAKKYPGATAVATVTVTATDTAGNVATTRATKKVKIARPKAKRKAKHKSKAKHKK